jgi:hypothetical protein
MKKYLIIIFLFSLALTQSAHATLTCSVTTTCNSPNVVIFRMSDLTNAHAELANQTNYSQLVCCGEVTGLDNNCTGTYATVVKLSNPTNAHTEQNSQSNYAYNACISVPEGGAVSVGYQSDNCTGFDTTVASMSGITNAHIGDSNAYTNKICASATAAPYLTFSISDNDIGFGTASPSASRYATGDTNGSLREVEAHTLSASTNATNGYTITVQGATLTYGSSTITPIGEINTPPTPGTEQFGLRIDASGGSGTVTPPYDGSGFAYAATETTSSQIASATTGDGLTTTYSARYVVNIANWTKPGDYTTTLVYIVTSRF